jgi:hypothetical protein
MKPNPKLQRSSISKIKKKNDSNSDNNNASNDDDNNDTFSTEMNQKMEIEKKFIQ